MQPLFWSVDSAAAAIARVSPAAAVRFKGYYSLSKGDREKMCLKDPATVDFDKPAWKVVDACLHWRSSPEGQEYWDNIHGQLKKLDSGDVKRFDGMAKEYSAFLREVQVGLGRDITIEEHAEYLQQMKRLILARPGNTEPV